MGLDMYLEERVFIGAQYEHLEVEADLDISVQGEKIEVDESRLSSVLLQKAYWRKANQIHGWFVENVQNGVDDCRQSYVSFEQIKRLRTIYCRILLLKNNNRLGSAIQWASKLLPPTEGFFFGDYDFDEYYFENLEDTVEALTELNPKNDYYYQSSW